MSPGRWLLLATAIAAAALGLALAARHYPAPDAGGWSTSASITDSASTSAAPLFDALFADLEGRPQALAQFKGRPLVINFWATWCAPCVEEMPDLQKIHAEYSGRGVIVGIGIDSPAAMRKFRDDLRIEFLLLAAGAGGSELALQLGNPSGALPFTVLVDTEGQLSMRRLGRIKPDELRLWLDLQLKKSKT